MCFFFTEPGPGANVFAPKFVEKLQPKRVTDGGVVQFECKVEGNPRPQITWFRQTAIIKPSHDFQVIGNVPLNVRLRLSIGLIMTRF